MDEIDVVARYTPTRLIVPLRFTWQNVVHSINSVGRRWMGEDGEHILVLTREELVFELMYQQGDDRWYLVRGFGRGGVI